MAHTFAVESLVVVDYYSAYHLLLIRASTPFLFSATQQWNTIFKHGSHCYNGGKYIEEKILNCNVYMDIYIHKLEQTVFMVFRIQYMAFPHEKVGSSSKTTCMFKGSHVQMLSVF